MLITTAGLLYFLDSSYGISRIALVSLVGSAITIWLTNKIVAKK